MIVTPYKTQKITVGANLLDTLDTYLPKISEKSVVIVTSKIVSICEGSILKNDGSIDKRSLIHKEADYYIDNESTKRYGIILTVKNGVLIASAGIDESNGNGYFILWPKNVMKTAAAIWEHIRKRNHIRSLGVIITDSRVTPLRWGTVGVGIGWCGFDPLNNYIDHPDIFGRNLHVTKASVLDGLAAAGVFVMGEGNEQTPLVVIKNVPMVHFVSHAPTTKETEALKISLTDDIYAPLIHSNAWQKGG